MAIINLCRILTIFLLFSNGETAYELFSIGCQLELEGKVEQAVEYYKRVKDLAPESPEIYISLANALYKIGKKDEGINTAIAALIIAPGNPQIYQTIAIGYIGKGDFNRAIKFYKEALQIDPENIELYYSLSILYEGVRKPEKARDVLINMPDTLKTSDIFTRLGSISGRLNDHGTAIEYYHQGYTVDSMNTTALIGIATGFDILNVKDSAIYYYDKALIEDTLILTVGKRLIDMYADTEQYRDLIRLAGTILEIDYRDGYIRRSLGFALYKLELFDQALQEFLLASRLDPLDTYSRFYLGRIYLEEGDYDAAMNEIRQAIEITPDFVELWVYLGFVAIDIKDFKTAEYAFTEAAYHGGDMVQINYLLGVVAEMQDDYSNAYFYYHKASKQDPKDLPTLEALANLCERIDKKDEAFDVFKEIIEIDTANAVALNYVGYSYAERHDSLEYALELIDKALIIEEDNGYYVDSRGWVFFQMGEYEKALEELNRAAEIIEDAVILEHLGDVYVKLNNYDKAREMYKRAVELDPTDKAIKKKLFNLQNK